VPGFAPGRAWIGFLGPRDLPPPITARLHQAIVQILELPDVQQVLAQNGLEIIANTPPEFAMMIKEDARIWNAAAASAGLISQ
jgi:tripartite-type tricarboxylate transporter receptor subunit TctC